MLKNGKYKIIYDKQFSNYPKYEFKVDGNDWFEMNTEKNQKYVIEKLDENSFRINPSEKQTDTITEIAKTLKTLGNPYYEITNCKKDTIEFILRVNLHVISYSGKFVRIK